MIDRHSRLAELLAGGFSRLATAADRRMVRPAIDTSLRHSLAVAPTLGRRLLPRLEEAASRSLQLQPAIRDVWHDHVLFTGDRVTGIVDYGALRIDTPLTDVARLIGSLVEDDQPRRHEALAAYSEVRPIDDDDRQLIDLLDRSSVMLGLMNWAEWLYVDQREFSDLDAVERRVTTLAGRLQALV